MNTSNIPKAFCQAYGMQEAMDKFIPNTYEPVISTSRKSKCVRFTYIPGSTHGGTAVYYDKYLFSFHATDPCRGRLTNTFDMVRTHKFLKLDAHTEPDTPKHKLPSYLAMCHMACNDARVIEEVKKDRLQKLSEAFEVCTSG